MTKPKSKRSVTQRGRKPELVPFFVQMKSRWWYFVQAYSEAHAHALAVADAVRAFTPERVTMDNISVIKIEACSWGIRNRERKGER